VLLSGVAANRVDVGVAVADGVVVRLGGVGAVVAVLVGRAVAGRAETVSVESGPSPA